MDNQSGPRPRVLLVAPRHSYRLGAYVRACHGLDASPIVVSDQAGALAGSVTTVDLGDPRTVDRLAALRPDAVIGTDAETLLLAAAVAARIGVGRANPASAVAATLDKAAQRRAGTATIGLSQPAFTLVGPGDDVVASALAVGFPVVVKPLSLTASRGVLRADDPLDVRAAVELIRPLVGPEDPVLIERFVAGGELALDGLLEDGRLHPLAVFDKPDAPQGPTFPETVLVTPSRLPADTVASALAAVSALCSTLGLRHGPVHAEFRIDADGAPQFLELAARTIGGRCAQVLRSIDGRSVEELVVALALGRPVDLRPDPTAVGVAMISAGRTGVVRAVGDPLAALSVQGIEDVWIEVAPGDRVEALPAGGSYTGFVLARAGTPELVEAALRRAAALLPLSVSPA